MRVDVARPDARSALEVFSLQRHGHAARSTARTRELVPLQLNGVFLRAPRLELRSPEQEIIFSERDGYVLASWPGTNASVRLGRREMVSAMMEDFLAQAALGERLAQSR